MEEKFTAACALLKKHAEQLDTKQTDACERVAADLTSLSTDLRADIEQRHDAILAAHAKLEKETQNASLTLASTLDEAKNDLAGDLRALEVKVDDKVQKSIETMSTKLEAMNTRVKKEMEPKLAETEMAARSIGAKLETLETRVVLEQDELKTGMTKSLEDISKELDELTEKVDGMTAGLDINVLLMGAASASGS